MARATNVAGATEAVRRIRARARTEGLELAYAAASAVCRDEKARSADRLDAANLICRIGGVFEGAGDEADDKPHHQMSRSELQAAATRASAVLARLDEEAAAEEADSSTVFE